MMRRIFVLLNLLPGLHSLLFYIYIVKVTINIGHVPSYQNPDPIELGYDGFYLLLLKSYDYAFITAAICLLTLFSLKSFKSNFSLSKIEVVGLIGSIFFLFSAFFDPFGFLLWFAD